MEKKEKRVVKLKIDWRINDGRTHHFIYNNLDTEEGIRLTHSQREKVIRKVEQHLRTTSRQLIKIDTEEEALQYLSDSFRAKLYCDFVGVIFIENDRYVPKTWSGDVATVERAFPLEVDQCSKHILHYSLTNNDATLIGEQCQLFNALKNAKVKTWFTVPIKDDRYTFGFCMIGFLNYVPLLEMGNHFDEFGQDVALAISLTRNREMQLKKIEGIEWIAQNFSIDAPFEESVGEITMRAGKGTNAHFACIYLYNDINNCFVFQPPSYGEMMGPKQLFIEQNYVLKEHFPYLEKTGGPQLTIPIAMDLKTIGVLHVERKKLGFFTDEDLRILSLLSDHIATLLENARLYNIEKENRNRLFFLLDYQQALVKETVKHDGFDGITSMLRRLFKQSVILFDRFMRPLSYELEEDEEKVIALAKEQADQLRRKNNLLITFNKQGKQFSVWPIKGGSDLLGYLAIRMSEKNLDEYGQLTIEMARNICSIQFIKQKLVLDATEQEKDHFMSQLLVEHVESEERILQYANLFMWDLFQPHRVALLSITLKEEEIEGCNLFEQQAKKATVWDYIKVFALEKNKDILTASFHDQYLLIVPVIKGKEKFWNELYEQMQQAVIRSRIKCHLFLGIGGKTEQIPEYYVSSQQARQALNIVENRFREKGYAFFEELGSYTILHHLDHVPDIHLFIDNQLGPLQKYAEKNNMDLLHTLRIYLQNNGNAKSTAEQLYLHRSSLLYRLERIETLLDVQLSDAEVRFNLMMAFKLDDMRRQPN